MSIVENRKAFHDYFIEERYEAGIVLEGWEVKAIRGGRSSIAEAYVMVRGAEIFLIGAHITPHANSMRWHTEPLDVSLLNEGGLLGPDVLLVHMNAATEDEWRMAADSGARVVFTPETELQMGMGLSPIEHAVSLSLRWTPPRHHLSLAD